MNRTAIVSGVGTADAVSKYLPEAYKVVSAAEANGRVLCLIEGEDKAGWTLDGYVAPRLQSGLYSCIEADSLAAHLAILGAKALVKRDYERELQAHHANVARIELLIEDAANSPTRVEAHGQLYEDGFAAGLTRALDVLNGKG